MPRPTVRIDVESLRQLLDDEHLTQDELAAAAGITRATLWRWLSGERADPDKVKEVQRNLAEHGYDASGLVAPEPQDAPLREDPREPAIFSSEAHRSFQFHPTGIGEDRVSHYNDDHILIYTIHDGFLIPAALGPLLEDKRSGFRRAFESNYAKERDWGAHAVALSTAYALELSGYYRFMIARNILDYGRFGGSAEPNVHYFNRRSLHPPVSDFIVNTAHASQVLAHYDEASETLKELLEQRFATRSLEKAGLITIGIHTFDKFDENGRRRPMVSIVSRSDSVQREGRMPKESFDPLFPPQIVESTFDNAVYIPISEALYKLDITERPNLPYLFPDGALEMRIQAWLWFRYLRDRFETERVSASVRREPEYEQVWRAIRNTNHRDLETVEISQLLHHASNPRPASTTDFDSVRRVYQAIREYREHHEHVLIDDYLKSRFRPFSAVIEIRKDLLWPSGDEELRGSEEVAAGKRNLDSARALQIGGAIAEGIMGYCDERHRRSRSGSR